MAADCKNEGIKNLEAVCEYSIYNAIQLSSNYRGFSFEIIGSSYNKENDKYRAIICLTHGNNKIYNVADISINNEYCVLHEINTQEKCLSEEKIVEDSMKSNDNMYKTVGKFFKDKKVANRVYYDIKKIFGNEEIDFQQKFATQKEANRVVFDEILEKKRVNSKSR